MALLMMAVAMAGQVVVTGPAVPVNEKKVCRRIEITGSRMGSVRECHTRSEWKAIERDRDATEVANDSMNTRGYNSGPDGSAQPVLGRP